MVGGSPGIPASSTTKTGRHDIAEILLKVALKHQKSKSIRYLYAVVSDILAKLLCEILPASPVVYGSAYGTHIVELLLN